MHICKAEVNNTHSPQSLTRSLAHRCVRSQSHTLVKMRVFKEELRKEYWNQKESDIQLPSPALLAWQTSQSHRGFELCKDGLITSV